MDITDIAIWLQNNHANTINRVYAFKVAVLKMQMAQLKVVKDHAKLLDVVNAIAFDNYQLFIEKIIYEECVAHDMRIKKLEKAKDKLTKLEKEKILNDLEIPVENIATQVLMVLLQNAVREEIFKSLSLLREHINRAEEAYHTIRRLLRQYQQFQEQITDASSMLQQHRVQQESIFEGAKKAIIGNIDKNNPNYPIISDMLKSALNSRENVRAKFSDGEKALNDISEIILKKQNTQYKKREEWEENIKEAKDVLIKGQGALLQAGKEHIADVKRGHQEKKEYLKANLKDLIELSYELDQTRFKVFDIAQSHDELLNEKQFISIKQQEIHTLMTAINKLSDTYESAFSDHMQYIEKLSKNKGPISALESQRGSELVKKVEKAEMDLLAKIDEAEHLKDELQKHYQLENKFSLEKFESPVKQEDNKNEMPLFLKKIHLEKNTGAQAPQNAQELELNANANKEPPKPKI